MPSFSFTAVDLVGSRHKVCRRSWSVRLRLSWRRVGRDPIPLDPWGRPYVYQFPGQRNPNGFELGKLRADGAVVVEGENTDLPTT
jgi:hypothetical protein